jgi:hypothetical protein
LYYIVLFFASQKCGVVWCGVVWCDFELIKAFEFLESASKFLESIAEQLLIESENTKLHIVVCAELKCLSQKEFFHNLTVLLEAGSVQSIEAKELECVKFKNTPNNPKDDQRLVIYIALAALELELKPELKTE